MIEKFTIENQRTKQSVSFSQDLDSDFIYNDGDIDWGNVGANHNTYTYPSQVGVSIFSSKLTERNVAIKGYAYSIISRDDINKYGYDAAKKQCYEDVLRKKALLNDLINPNDYIRIYTSGYFLEGKPSSSIIYSNIEEENNEYFCRFLISIYCNNPMFKKESIVKTNLSKSIPFFHFPLILKPTGIVMSERENYLLLDINNEGNSSIGAIITFEAKADVKNPSIEDVGSGKKIIINKTLSKGEKVIINTADGEKSVVGVIAGVEYNYFKYWDFNNDWIKFEGGTTLVGYSSEDYTEGSLDVMIEINPEKFALEEL